MSVIEKVLVRIFKLVENPLSDTRRRRSRLSIIAEVLDLARRGAIKTRIMYGASLSFVQLEDYLSFLLDVNLLKAVETAKKTIYKTTNKGLRYLQSYMEIEELLKKEKENIP
jgi:predicted transcriptional regulator